MALQLAWGNAEFRLTRASIALAEGDAADARTYALEARLLAPAEQQILAAADRILTASAASFAGLVGRGAPR